MYKVLIADDNKQIVSILSEYCKKNKMQKKLFDKLIFYDIM